MTASVVGSPPPGESVTRSVRTEPAVTVMFPVSSSVVLGLPAGVMRMRYVPGATATYGEAAPNASVGTAGVAEDRSAVGEVMYIDTAPGAAATWTTRNFAWPVAGVGSSAMNSAPNCDSPGAGMRLNVPGVVRSRVKSTSEVPVPLACACRRCDASVSDTYGDAEPNPI